jgi:hypothetical protein
MTTNAYNDEKISAQLDAALAAEITDLIQRAFLVSSEVGAQVADMFTFAKNHPLTDEEAERLLSKVVQVLKASAERNGDMAAIAALSGDTQQIVERIRSARRQMSAEPTATKSFKHLLMAEHNGTQSAFVRPNPWFHGKEIPMLSGFVKTRDIVLWDANERLDIHLNQFRHKYGRGPNPDELLNIMLSKMSLPGVEDTDAFEIAELARSIANNGVRKSPILDTDGTLLDGNRRVTACHYILNSSEFTLEQKKRAEHIFVWQLTQFATEDDRNRVVVSLNFESDCKQDWPHYVKARKVAEAWRGMIAVEPRIPSASRQTQMKKDLSQRFALGPNATEVTRYLRMVQWADEFEDYHIDVCSRDPYEVKHKANERFQYFDELSKGVGPGTVARTLNEDESLKHVAFDLLFKDKFRNWTLIRDLRYIAGNQDARDLLRKANDVEVHNESDLEEAQDLVENACVLVRRNKAEQRSLGSNTRIEAFVSWLEDLPVKAFRDEIKPENLFSLLRALRLVEKQVEALTDPAE